MGQKMINIGTGQRKSINNYKSQESYYQALNCKNCPLKSQCHKAKGNREINHRLNELKSKARELQLSPEGLQHRSNRPIEPEAVFGQLKNNNKFNRFTFVGIEKVEVELILMTIGHNLRKMVTKAIVFDFFISKIRNKQTKKLNFSVFIVVQKYKISVFKIKTPNQKFERIAASKKTALFGQPLFFILPSIQSITFPCYLSES